MFHPTLKNVYVQFKLNCENNNEANYLVLQISIQQFIQINIHYIIKLFWCQRKEGLLQIGRLKVDPFDLILIITAVNCYLTIIQNSLANNFPTKTSSKCPIILYDRKFEIYKLIISKIFNTIKVKLYLERKHYQFLQLKYSTISPLNKLWYLYRVSIITPVMYIEKMYQFTWDTSALDNNLNATLVRLKLDQKYKAYFYKLCTNGMWFANLNKFNQTNKTLTTFRSTKNILWNVHFPT